MSEIHSTSGAIAPATKQVWHDLESASTTYKVCKNTLRNWSNNNVIPCYRFGMNKSRRFLDSDLRAMLGLRVEESAGEVCNQSNAIRVLAFARVSSPAQAAAGDLQRQSDRVMEFCKNKWGNDASVDQHIAVRSGLNFECESARLLLTQITSRTYKYLVVLHRERLARVAFTLIETLCKIVGTEIIVIEKQAEDDDKQAELIQDILALSFVAGCRINGKRGSKAKFKELPQDVIDLVQSLALSGHSEREIYRQCKKQNKSKDNKGNEFSIGIVRRVVRQFRKQQQVSVALNGNASTSPASFSEWAKQRLRFGPTKRRGVSQRKIVKAYTLHCEQLGAKPDPLKTVLRVLQANCPKGPLEVATGRVKRPTEVVWPECWLMSGGRKTGQKPQAVGKTWGVNVGGSVADSGGTLASAERKRKGKDSRRMADGGPTGNVGENVAAHPAR